MTRIITVLKTGGDFDRHHVQLLRDECRTYAPGVEFICLSDDPLVPGYQPLQHNWKGWWSKMEIYRYVGPCLYIDLDTVILRDLGVLLRTIEGHDFIALRDFNPSQRMLGTGLLGWQGDMLWLYTRFVQAPQHYMKANNSPRWWGDQGFIEQSMTTRGKVPSYWQDVCPDSVISYKKHWLGGKVPFGARIICFHGNPRPWQTNLRGGKAA